MMMFRVYEQYHVRKDSDWARFSCLLVYPIGRETFVAHVAFAVQSEDETERIFEKSTSVKILLCTSLWTCRILALSRAWNEANPDNSESLSSVEFYKVLHYLRPQFEASRLRIFYELFDQEDNGKISREVFNNAASILNFRIYASPQQVARNKPRLARILASPSLRTARIIILLATLGACLVIIETIGQDNVSIELCLSS